MTGTRRSRNETRTIVPLGTRNTDGEMSHEVCNLGQAARLAEVASSGIRSAGLRSARPVHGHILQTEHNFRDGLSVIGEFGARATSSATSVGFAAVTLRISRNRAPRSTTSTSSFGRDSRLYACTSTRAQAVNADAVLPGCSVTTRTARHQHRRDAHRLGIPMATIEASHAAPRINERRNSTPYEFARRRTVKLHQPDRAANAAQSGHVSGNHFLRIRKA